MCYSVQNTSVKSQQDIKVKRNIRNIYRLEKFKVICTFYVYIHIHVHKHIHGCIYTHAYIIGFILNEFIPFKANYYKGI